MSPERAFLEDIVHSARLALSYIDGISLTDFEADNKTQDAVIRRLELIGEAVKWVDKAVKESMPDVEWRRMGDMRNLMIHQYWDVDVTIVWTTVQDDLPRLISGIEAHFS